MWDVDSKAEDRITIGPQIHKDAHYIRAIACREKEMALRAE
jgi:hypothetical protein